MKRDANQSTIISTYDHLIFLVKFNNSSMTYIVTIQGMNDLLKENKHCLEYIKEYDSVKQRFGRCSKSRLNGVTNFNTELNIELERRNFIK